MGKKVSFRDDVEHQIGRADRVVEKLSSRQNVILAFTVPCFIALLTVFLLWQPSDTEARVLVSWFLFLGSVYFVIMAAGSLSVAQETRKRLIRPLSRMPSAMAPIGILLMAYAVLLIFVGPVSLDMTSFLLYASSMFLYIFVGMVTLFLPKMTARAMAKKDSWEKLQKIMEDKFASKRGTAVRFLLLLGFAVLWGGNSYNLLSFWTLYAQPSVLYVAISLLLLYLFIFELTALRLLSGFKSALQNLVGQYQDILQSAMRGGGKATKTRRRFEELKSLQEELRLPKSRVFLMDDIARLYEEDAE